MSEVRTRHLPGREDDDVRPIEARWIITARLELLSAAQIGSHEADYCDQTFARDENGDPILPGSTLAGALRQALADRLLGYRTHGEPPEAELLFGSSRTGDARQSDIIIFDGRLAQRAPASIRDGVRIDPADGLAMDKFKFDREVSTAGLAFYIRVECVVGAQESEQDLISLLLTSLHALTDDSLALGARKSRGLGRLKATGFRARRFDLTRCQDWLDYASSDPERPIPAEWPEADDPFEAAAAQLPGKLLAPVGEDLRRTALIVLDLDLDGALLVRSPGIEAGDPDVSHLIENGQALAPGTSNGGLLRHHVLRIANTLGMPGAEATVNDLFGGDVAAGGAASRVTVSEPVITGGSGRMRQARVAIDRLTGGALDTALYDEAPVFGGGLQLTLRVKRPTGPDMRLLLLASRDIAEGLLPLGGTAAVGRGVARGEVKLVLAGEPPLTLSRNHAEIEERLHAMEAGGGNGLGAHSDTSSTETTTQ